jgi:hypothetical protein
MPLQSGARLGNYYEVLGPLGAGGPPSLALKLCASFGASTEAQPEPQP